MINVVSSHTLGSVLFVPGNRPDLISKSSKSTANAICIDLEDGVSDAAKEGARQQLSDHITFLKQADRTVFVRINAIDSGLHHYNDVSFVASFETTVDGLVVPKMESWDQALKFDKHLWDVGVKKAELQIIAMIEDPKALCRFETYTPNTGRISALLLGTEDFAVACHCAPESPLIETAYLRLVLAARSVGVSVFGIPSGIGDFRDLEKFTAAAMIARQSGGDGAFAIHPKQLDVLNSVFQPTYKEIDWAKTVVQQFRAALQKGSGIVTVGGKMIDMPVYLQAQRVLSLSKQYEEKTKEV